MPIVEASTLGRRNTHKPGFCPCGNGIEGCRLVAGVEAGLSDGQHVRLVGPGRPGGRPARRPRGLVVAGQMYARDLPNLEVAVPLVDELLRCCSHILTTDVGVARSRRRDVVLATDGDQELRHGA